MHDIPWYRQFWPWFLIALPALVLVAGVWTCVLAWQNRDEMLVERDLRGELIYKAMQPDATRD